MPENSLKLMSKNHRIRCTVALGTFKCCQLTIFYLQKGKSLLQHTVDNEVSSLVRFLTFYENLFIGQETSARFCINGCPY